MILFISFIKIFHFRKGDRNCILYESLYRVFYTPSVVVFFYLLSKHVG